MNYIVNLNIINKIKELIEYHTNNEKYDWFDYDDAGRVYTNYSPSYCIEILEFILNELIHTGE